MQLVRHSMIALFLLISAATVSAQAPAQSPEGESELLVFIGGKQVGREEARLSRAGGNWLVNSTGAYGPPLNFKLNRFEVRYTADWQPIELHVNAVQGTRALELNTSFSVTTAINEITQGGVTNSKTDQVSARTVVLPNNFYGGYQALAARLADAKAGTEIPVYVAPQTEVRVTVKGVTAEQIQTPTGTVATRRFDLSFANPGGALEAAVTIDQSSRFVRLEIPSAALLVTRADLSTIATRTQATRNPTDADVTIPAAGFNLGGTITTPPTTGTLRHPAVLLVGTGQGGRDEKVDGVPLFAELAGALAAKDMVVLRYDKRGTGQSGGRVETATLQDYAEDAVAAVKWLAKRRDVDQKRIVVVGRGEGGWVGMLAAAREKKIASLVLLGTAGTTGADLVLEQQRQTLEEMKTAESERQQKIELQRKIHDAVVSGRGWETIPPELRRAADTPWFRSYLTFDPAKAMNRIKQPILILDQAGGGLPDHHAERLAELARARKKAAAVEVRQIEKTTAAELAAAVAGWLPRQ